MIRNYTNTGQTSTLVSAIGATDTTATLANYAGDPSPPFTASFSRGTAAEEVVLVTAVSGSTVTITRGYDGTNAQAQGAGATFQEVVVAQDFREANTHVNATSGVHGLTGAPVGTTDAQTVSNKTLVSCSFTSPTFTGTVTGATVNLTTLTVAGLTTLANVTASGTLAVTGAASFAAPVSLNGGATVPTGKGVTLTDAPSAATDAVNKSYADALGTAAPTASTIVRRDASGRTQVAAPSAATDVANKSYVDGKFTDTGWLTPTIATGWSVRAGARVRVKDGIAYFSCDILRTGGDITAPGSNTLIFTLPTGAGPAVQAWYANAATNNSEYGEVLFNTSREVRLFGTITNNNVLVVSASYPVD